MKNMNLATSVLATALLGATSVSVNAAQNPFAAHELSSGYSLAAGEKTKERSCGEGKCGGSPKHDSEARKDGHEGGCGGKTREGGCGAEGKGKEGKCGAAKPAKASLKTTGAGDLTRTDKVQL
ncbi:hypothetical protein [Pseudomonas fluorescens]|uniref:hypothetical protein n=1 Tax=Pseudomonas fluorescens TaxID=294 RepID=UPI001FB0AF83|nr:hypothetical protein [Pseudomonas fluorescens]